MICRHEYGEPEVTLELISNMDEAIDHLHENGSGHTECIITGNSIFSLLHRLAYLHTDKLGHTACILNLLHALHRHCSQAHCMFQSCNSALIGMVGGIASVRTSSNWDAN